MTSDTSILTVTSDEGSTLSATDLPTGATFDDTTHSVDNPTADSNGVMEFTSTDSNDVTSKLSVPYSVKMGATEIPTIVAPTATGHQVYDSDVAEFVAALNAIAPVRQLTTPTVITADQAKTFWTALNIASRNTTDFFFDQLTVVSSAATNILFPVDVINYPQQRVITDVLTALYQVSQGTYNRTSDSNLLRRFRSSYLISYIRRKMA